MIFVNKHTELIDMRFLIHDSYDFGSRLFYFDSSTLSLVLE